MLSTFSVLALLLAADGGTPAPKESPKASPVEVTALAVDVDFVCRVRSTQSLILTPKAQGQLQVPESCPDAGADWRLTVDCTAERCSGYIRTKAGAIALIQGTRKQLEVKPLAEEHPPTLDQVQVSITGQHLLTLEKPEAHQPPTQLLLQLPSVTGVYTLASSEPMDVVFEHRGKRLVLRAQLSRSDDGEHVHVQLWNAQREPLLDETLKLDESRELDCQRLANICEGKLKVLVRENQRVL
ncbi:hypothetical protein [Archangium sp.]|jgi:hypothetical protein|uniref:hypothetical protein n=1 Tax=Archangium sp. TaxID=1872627 RepID=UPI002EDB55AD